MRKIHEIKRDLALAIEAAKTATGEARSAAFAKVNELSEELRQAVEIENAQQLIADDRLRAAENKERRAFSIVKFIREASEGTFTGVEEEVRRIGEEEVARLGITGRPVRSVYIPSCALRAAQGQNYTTPADGGNLTEVAPINYFEALRERMALTSLGATYLGDLVGTVPFVYGSNVEAAWEGEADEDQLVKMSFDKSTMTPKRVAITMSYTRDLLRQTSRDVEAMVINELTNAHAVALERAAINGTGSGQPLGILNTTGIGAVAVGTNGGPITWKQVVELETAVNDKNAYPGNRAYLTNAKVIGAMKTTEMATGSGRFLLDPNAGSNVNGYPITWTGLVPSNLTKGSTSGKCSALIFGNWSDLWIGQWGGIDIVVDPYTAKRTAEIEITINAYHDVKVVRPESFAAVKDITIA